VFCACFMFLCVLESENERESDPFKIFPSLHPPSPTHGLDVFTIKLLDRFSSTLDMTNVWRGKPRPRTFYGNGDRFTGALPTAPNTRHFPSPTFGSLVCPLSLIHPSTLLDTHAQPQHLRRCPTRTSHYIHSAQPSVIYPRACYWKV
jgi:hypothetical protein